jgi:hypothetical protein
MNDLFCHCFNLLSQLVGSVADSSAEFWLKATSYEL